MPPPFGRSPRTPSLVRIPAAFYSVASKGEIRAAVLAEIEAGFYGSPAQMARRLRAAGKPYAYSSVWSILRSLGARKEVLSERVGTQTLYGRREHANRLMVDLDTMRAEWV